MVDEDIVQRDYCRRQLANMKQLCRRFYAPGETHAALQAALTDRDDFANAVRFAAENLLTENATHDHDDDDGWWSLATVDGVAFLGEFLPADAYRALFDALQSVPALGNPFQGVPIHPFPGVPTDGDPLQRVPTSELTVGDTLKGISADEDPLQGAPTEGDPLQGVPPDGHRLQGVPAYRDLLQGDPTDGNPLVDLILGVLADGDPLHGVPIHWNPLQGARTDRDLFQGVPTDGDPLQGVPPDRDPLQGVPALGDPKAVSRRCRALSAAAYGATTDGRLDRAAVHAAAAYDLLSWVDDEARAFCFFCLAVVCRKTDSTKAATLARRSVEVYRGLEQQPCAWSPPERIRSRERIHDSKSRAAKPPRMGVKAINGGMFRNGGSTEHDSKSGFNSSIHAAELLASILADLGTTQSALNACRQSDEAGFQALDPGHPLTVRGYLVRQRLWTALGLMERARQAAAKAAEAAVIYYAEEHPETGQALACLCESTGHRGPVDDSICDAIHALAVRIKVGGLRFLS